MPGLLTTASNVGQSEPAASLKADNLCAPSATVLQSSKAEKSWQWETAEIANSITHGLGLLLSVIGTIVLLHAAASTSDQWLWLAVLIYCVTMVAVYAFSTASHLFTQPKVKHVFRMLDQGWIYLFIAGTFTPIAAAFLRGGAWWILLAAIWTVALAGFISKVALNHRINNVSTAIPLILGWMPLLGGRPMFELVPVEVRWWMLAGGVCYTVGTLFLMYDLRHRYLHAMWHAWVIAGTACHFWAILHYAVPAA
jgi:hemolysin III